MIYTCYSDLCSSFPSYEDTNSNITDNGQAIKFIENGIRVFLVNLM